MDIIKNFKRNKTAFMASILRRLSFMFKDDELYLKLLYLFEMHKKLDLNNPTTFNEKLQWLKLYNRRPEYTRMVDKYEAKKYAASLIGEKHIIPTLGVWDRFEDIDFEKLPNQFVLKTTNGGGNLGVIICKDKAHLDKEHARNVLNKSLKSNIYKTFREWPYKNVKPRILAEKYVVDESGELRDYKFTCTDGTAHNVMLCMGRNSGDTKFYFFDRGWNLLRINKRGKDAPEGFTVPKPQNVEQMFDIAAKLSQGLPYARVDLYNVNGTIYFGEITFYPQSGLDPNLLPETDLHFGQLIKLPSKHKQK